MRAWLLPRLRPFGQHVPGQPVRKMPVLSKSSSLPSGSGVRSTPLRTHSVTLLQAMTLIDRGNARYRKADPTPRQGRLLRVFEDVVQGTVNFVRRGFSIRLVGPPGSGRTNVLGRVTHRLENLEFVTHKICGLVTHRAIPFSGLAALDLPRRQLKGGVADQVETLAIRLAGHRKHVLVADDLQYVDLQTLAVLEAVRYRSDVPLITSAAESLALSTGMSAVLSHGRELMFHLRPLRLRQVHALALQVLGEPVDAATALLLLNESEGNPRLIVRLADTGALTGLLSNSAGTWRTNGGSLWNPHMRGVVEVLLNGLTPDEFKALHTLAIIGTARLSAVQKVIQDDALYSFGKARTGCSLRQNHS